MNCFKNMLNIPKLSQTSVKCAGDYKKSKNDLKNKKRNSFIEFPKIKSCRSQKCIENKLKSVKFSITPTVFNSKSKENALYLEKKTKINFQPIGVKTNLKKIKTPKRRSSKQLKPRKSSNNKNISFKIRQKSNKKIQRTEANSFFENISKRKMMTFKEKYKVLKLLGNGSNSRVF